MTGLLPAPVVLWATVAVYAVAALQLACLAYAAKVHGLWTTLWRWHTGNHWTGDPQTDAGAFRRGVKPLTKTGHAHPHWHRPRSVRVLIHNGTTVTETALLTGLLLARTLTVALTLATVTAGLTLTVVTRARSWRHNREWTRPLHKALAPVAGVPDATPHRSWLTVPRDFRTREGARVRVDLPEKFNGSADDTRRVIAATVINKLSLESPSVTWHLAGARPCALFTVTIPPPPKVRLDTRVTVREPAADSRSASERYVLARGSRLPRPVRGAALAAARTVPHRGRAEPRRTITVRELLEACPDTAPMLGLGHGGRLVSADIGTDPHLLASMRTGGGKSALFRLLLSQELRRGAVGLILDVKRLSHAWTRGMESVRYVRDIADIHDALLWLSEELDRRNVLADEGADLDGNTDHVDVGPRIIVVAEELNALANKLAMYWRNIKSSSDPSQSPAVMALNDVLFMGRQVKINVMACAQMLTARTVGGPEARENFGTRIMARYTVQAWRMLVPDIWPPPKVSKHTGRVQVCIGGEALETQVVFVTAAEARDLAMTGNVVPFPELGPLTPKVPHVAGSLAPIGLGKAVDTGVLHISLGAARKARQRDPDFPPVADTSAGGELLYDPDQLAAWERNRVRVLRNVNAEGTAS